MNEKIKQGEKVNKSRRAFLAGSANVGINIVGGSLLGYGALNSAVQGLNKNNERPRILPMVPTREGMKKYSKVNAITNKDQHVWIRNDAKRFLDEHTDVGFDRNIGLLTVTDEINNRVFMVDASELVHVKEVRVIGSSNGRVIGVYYLKDNEGKSGRSVQVFQDIEGKLGVEEYKFP
ncbi:MAG: hypothetical protein NUV88_03035 [Candidatus Kaiserbacteria bacterium]|nr:hypothetical protein [Candidatus Kaiserbacteria bacterium]